MCDASDSDDVSLSLFFDVVFCLTYPSTKYGFQLQPVKIKSVNLTFFGGGVDEGVEMSDASDSDEVSKRFGLRSSGSRVEFSDSHEICGGSVDNYGGELS